MAGRAVPDRTGKGSYASSTQTRPPPVWNMGGSPPARRVFGSVGAGPLQRLERRAAARRTTTPPAGPTGGGDPHAHQVVDAADLSARISHAFHKAIQKVRSTFGYCNTLVIFIC